MFTHQTGHANWDCGRNQEAKKKPSWLPLLSLWSLPRSSGRPPRHTGEATGLVISFAFYSAFYGFQVSRQLQELQRPLPAVARREAARPSSASGLSSGPQEEGCPGGLMFRL